ncbi:MAG: SPASM domain-containing protein [Bacteroidetes bacterium]|nr:SPASM domain-containing protein [Bacteroidota bacterium]
MNTSRFTINIMLSLRLTTFEIKNLLVQRIGKSNFLWKFVKVGQSLSFVYNYAIHCAIGLNSRTSVTEINIELVSYCNLRCRMCSLDHLKPKVRMTADLLKLFFQQLLNDKRFRNIDTIHLYNAGEVLLHPKIEEMLAIIKQAKEEAISRKIPFPKVALLTNATILDEKKSAILISADILDNIRFSMDGGNKENFEQMRDRAKWDEFATNIETFCALNKQSSNPIKTGIITLIDYKYKADTSWMSNEFKKLLNTVDGYELRYAHNWGGDIDVPEISTKRNYKIGCSLLMHQMVFLPNGDITVCCADLNSKGVIGNIQSNTLYEIYKKPERLKMLSLFMRNRKHEIELCKNCESF